MRGTKRGPNLACRVLYRGSSKRSGDARELSCKGVARIALRHAMPVARATLGSPSLNLPRYLAKDRAHLCTDTHRHTEPNAKLRSCGVG